MFIQVHFPNIIPFLLTLFLGRWSFLQFSNKTFEFSFVICFFNFQHQDHPTEPPATPYLDPTHILTADSHFCTMGSHILAAPQLMGMPSLGV